MDTQIVLLVLLAALLHASWNALVKTGPDPLLSLASLHVTAALVVIPIIFFVPLPNAECIPYLGASVAIHWLYYGLLSSAYRVGDLSHVYPLSRGIAPLLVAVVSALVAGEFLPGLTMAGIVVASGGIILLSFAHGLPWRHDPKPVVFALGTGASIAAYTVIDGLGVRHSFDAISYITWLFLLEGATFGPFIYFLRRKQVIEHWRQRGLALVGGGLASAGAYGLVIYAMNSNPMAMVSALRETSVLMAALIGTLILKEGFGKTRVSAAVLVTGGVFIMNLGA